MVLWGLLQIVYYLLHCHLLSFGKIWYIPRYSSYTWNFVLSCLWQNIKLTDSLLCVNDNIWCVSCFHNCHDCFQKQCFRHYKSYYVRQFCLKYWQKLFVTYQTLCHDFFWDTIPESWQHRFVNDFYECTRQIKLVRTFVH